MLAAWAIARRVFGLVPWWAWVAAAALVWGGWQRHTATVATRQAEQAKASAALQAAAAQAERQARQLEQTYTAHVRSAADAYATNLRAARAAADRARLGHDGLRDAIAAAPGCAAAPSAAASGRPDGAAELRAVLGSCVASLRDVAAVADEDAAKLKGLQDYIRAIGAAPAASAAQ